MKIIKKSTVIHPPIVKYLNLRYIALPYSQEIRMKDNKHVQAILREVLIQVQTKINEAKALPLLW